MFELLRTFKHRILRNFYSMKLRRKWQSKQRIIGFIDSLYRPEFKIIRKQRIGNWAQ
jgi:hypothetical protein